MPSEMNPLGWSPSPLFPEACFSDERQVGAWKMNYIPGHNGVKTDGTVRSAGIASPAHENRLPPDSQMEKGFDLPSYYLNRGRNLNLSPGKHLVGPERAVSRSLPNAIDHQLSARINLNKESASYCLDGEDKINFIGATAQHENSLFSSSMSDLFTRKLKLPSSNDVYGHSVGANASLYEEEEAFESHKELEAQTIGNLLPDDDDLLSGVTDGFCGSIRGTNNGEDVEDLDLFSSVGGFELGEDGSSKRNFGLSDVNYNNEAGIYGGSIGKHGFMKLHSAPSNLATGLSGSLSLGGKRSMDNGTVNGPKSTRGDSIGPHLDYILNSGVSSSVPNGLSSLSRVESGNQSTIAQSNHLRSQLNFDHQGRAIFHPCSFPEFHAGLTNGAFGSPRTVAANINAGPSEIINNQQFHRVSSPNGQSIEFNEVFGSSGNRRLYLWNNPNHPQSQATMWPDSPSFVNVISTTHSLQLQAAVPRSPSHMLNTRHPLNNHHIGSAPSTNPSLWENCSYAVESPNATMFHPGSLGNMMISHGIFPQTLENSMDVSIPFRSIGLHPHHQRLMVFPTGGQMIPMMTSCDSPNERTRNRRNEGSTSQSENKKHFDLHIDRILQGEDKRTTLMLKNIPNKYTSKMLLAAIDERHKGTYDFIYLPIDFKNKCNVGYAFINMTDTSQIVPFYKTFNGKKWEKFNSEKVATLAYGRIQGKCALIAHFQNSSLMIEDKRCRPILFHTDGPNAGDQVPFPMGTNIRPRSGKVRANASEENILVDLMPSNSVNEDYSNADTSASGKDSD